MDRKDQFDRIAAGLQVIHEGLEDMITDCASANNNNNVLAALLGALQQHAAYVQASVAAASIQDKRHPLDVWGKN